MTMNGELNNHRLDTTIVDLFDRWAAKAPDRPAAEWQGEILTYHELQNASLHVSRALLLAGVQPRSKVPLLTQMSLEMLPAVLGILRVGACYAPLDLAMWSTTRVEAALQELSAPIVFATTTCPGLQLPLHSLNFQKEWLSQPIQDAGGLMQRLNVLRDGLRDDDLAWIIFTSGTTGKPKGVMVYHRAIFAITVLNHSDDLEAAAERGIRCLLAFSVAFDGCAGVVWTTLTRGGTLAMASPTEFPQVSATCDLLHLTPSMLAILDPAGPYDAVRYIFLGAEAPQLDVVRQWITPKRKVFNTYGPSETTCIVSFGELKSDEPPPFGDLINGVKIVLVNEELRECSYGEVLIAGPGLAAGYLNNPQLTAEKFIVWNGQRFYRTGDLARITADGQYIWAGRLDSLVKNRGFLINLETEVEPAILSFPTVSTAVAMKWRDRLVAFVQPADVDALAVRDFMRTRFDPFVIPDEIIPTDKFPLNVNGKTDRLALDAKLANRDSVSAVDSQPNGYTASALDAAIRAISLCLNIATSELNEQSSFLRLGGNSLTAIRLRSILRQQGYSTSIIQILRSLTIQELATNMKHLPTSERCTGDAIGSDDHKQDSHPVLATDVQKAMLTRSLKDTKKYALISTIRYVGDRDTVPSALQLRNALDEAVTKHSIFRTRFDLSTFNLCDIPERKLNWSEVRADETNFDDACIEAEEQAWLDLGSVTQAELEIPYFCVTCVYVPNRKALAFITRIHHVLTDVFGSAIFMRDVDRLLAGQQVSQGPRFQDFARFANDYKRQRLTSATSFFENMLGSLPYNALLQPPRAHKATSGQVSGLARFVSSTTITKAALDACARQRGLTTSAIVYAAWALFLSKVTHRDKVGFSVSLSGRTVPWPAAQDVVGVLTTRAPVVATISAQASVQDFLTDVHKTILDILEYDGLMHSLPDNVMQDPRTKSSSVLFLLDVPSTSQNWSSTDRQEHHYLLSWYVSQAGEGLHTEFEVQLSEIDSKWAEDVKDIPGRLLDGLVIAQEQTPITEVLD